MGVQARVHVIKSTEKKMDGGWTLCFQWCAYNYSDGGQQKGYRFIWRRPDGTLQGARGQARLPTMDLIHEMLEQAKREGWGYIGDAKDDY
ncbi:hypothetical protein [Aeromonas caviae]|jgi:hypothetical protein|uniref:hypothetical protein n=1 Tax=Aeromonas caviae TaxID=648 RepID=UPI000C8D0669|nr:hypothetical protein [Aeromonas caviae]MAY75736.1 hypothetical protein [Phycisphaerae bacterium]MEA9433407.1 hypothetical protein [Aeromonas caviae]HAQ86922.1 hypothetical protein [Pseudomonas sp.]|tara:strand:+ start:8141 stop:8410 length:270 start_codon:yes stop_codon:yes gene_type:complete